MSDSFRQRGQVLVIFTGTLFVLLLIAALVFDLGMSWMLRRQEQNAIDPGAIAAAKYVQADFQYGATPQMIEAACHYARASGFFPSASTDDGCVQANDPESAQLTVNYPPVGTSAGRFEGYFGYVQVSITRQHPNFFWQIFGNPTSSVTASAVAANTSGDSNSYSLIALDPNSDSASGKIGGNGGTAKVSIVPATDPATGQPYQGGYVQVNSTFGGVVSPPTLASCALAGSSGTGALQVTGGSGITAPAIFVTGTCAENNNATITTSAPGNGVTQGALQVGDPLADLQPPDPSAYPAGQCGAGGPTTGPTGNASKGCGVGSMAWSADATCSVTGSTCVTLNPGTYYGGWNISNNVTLQLTPGIYIMAGGGIKLNSGGSLTSVMGGSGSPAPVLIFSTDNPASHSQCINGTASSTATQCQGPIDLEAQATLDLAPMDSGPYKGMLLWQDGNASGSLLSPNSSGVTIGGQVNMNIAGTIYAPKVQVTLVGGGSVGGTASIQIISWQWMIGGGSNLTMPYDPNQLYHLEQRGLVH